MKKCILIQANGNNERLGRFFAQPKYELFYGKRKIIDIIISECLATGNDIYLAIRKGVTLDFDCSNVTLIPCEQTFSRIDTLSQCFPLLKNYESVIIHDGDVIINRDVLGELSGNSLAVTAHRRDGLKYGFVELDPNFNYLSGNEKKEETNYITIGSYCVDFKEFSRYMDDAQGESLLLYYNNIKNVSVVYSTSHVCLGDINSYMENLWLSS